VASPGTWLWTGTTASFGAIVASTRGNIIRGGIWN
jgi:hypothetical protein